MTDAITAFAQYRVKAGEEQRFLDILAAHHRTLRELELVTDRQVEVYVGQDKGDGLPLIIEVFDWVNPEASAAAHTHPRVSVIWESMGPLCEDRGVGRPAFAFPNGRRVELS
jgi:hypothetical protein